jgi:lipopolysaccharide/colanic/teichoic acid biosynthesis glycosyltransferase
LARDPYLRGILNGSVSWISELHRDRLLAVPGMTGYWQVSGRGELTLEEMARLDVLYAENWSLIFDIQIILRTVGAVLRCRGAY